MNRCADPTQVQARYVVMERGVIGTKPTARLIQERWMPNGRIEGIVFERTGPLADGPAAGAEPLVQQLLNN